MLISACTIANTSTFIAATGTSGDDEPVIDTAHGKIQSGSATDDVHLSGVTQAATKDDNRTSINAQIRALMHIPLCSNYQRNNKRTL